MHIPFFNTATMRQNTLFFFELLMYIKVLGLRCLLMSHKKDARLICLNIFWNCSELKSESVAERM